MRSKFSLFLFVVLPFCIRTPRPQDYSTIATIYAIASQTQCMYAGLSGSVAASGVLVCSTLAGTSCGSTLNFATSSARQSVTGDISAIGTTYPACATAVSNALTEINSLTIPAYHYMNRAGGTTGPHTTANFVGRNVTSCDSLGLNSSAYFQGATRLATASEMGFLSSARGLVAIKDAVGTCRTQMGLSASENTIAQAVMSNTVTRFAVCYYGAQDVTKTHCPVSLQSTDLMFSGISSW